MPSQKQMEYLAYAWQCFDSEPKVDYEAFRTLFSLSSLASAREVLRVAKKAVREDPHPPGTPTKKRFLDAKPNAFATLTAKNAAFSAAAAQARVDKDDENDDDDAIQYTKSTPRRSSVTGSAHTRKQYIATPIRKSGGGAGGKTKTGSGTVSGAKRARQKDTVADEDGEVKREESPSMRGGGGKRAQTSKAEDVNDGMDWEGLF